MSDQESQQLMRQFLAQHDEVAARELFERYSERLIRLACTKMSQRLQQKVAPEDVVQSAFKSLFARAQNGQFKIDASGKLWPLLVGITINKIRRQVKLYGAKKRSASREELLDADAAFFDRQPQPDEAQSLCETVEQLLKRKTHATQQLIIDLYLQGQSLEAIATQSKRTVARVRQVVHDAEEELRHELQQP